MLVSNKPQEDSRTFHRWSRLGSQTSRDGARRGCTRTRQTSLANLTKDGRSYVTLEAMRKSRLRTKHHNCGRQVTGWNSGSQQGQTSPKKDMQCVSRGPSGSWAFVRDASSGVRPLCGLENRQSALVEANDASPMSKVELNAEENHP